MARDLELVMLVLMTVAYVLAQSWLRRNKLTLPTPLKKLTGFNSFWYSHHLFVIICAFCHSRLLPLPHQAMVQENVRTYRSRFKSVRILKVVVYPGNVMALHISKPQGFKYTSGQYICVNCPDVSLFEWHPFTITSTPEDDYISVHIQTLGDWTSQLKAVFIEACEPTLDDQSVALQIDMLGKNKSRMPRLLIDGPYGAPAQDYGNYEVLLLIGLGIGATPLISILKDILNIIKKQQRDLEVGVMDNGVKNKKSKRAYFCWVTREKGSIEWFKGLMNEVAENDKEGVIELHNYCTGGYEEGGAQSALITMIQSLNYAKKGMGTRIKTYSTRPNWHDVFEYIALKYPNKRVGVFYCGTHKLVGQLRRLSLDFSRKTSTKFDFHKENF
ncbi:Riboflavin synthase-like beta-barrel [Sesbania bispinosa]|nr:Riboflavin synthase-like beta-barrel [Sesbania bispinosa]